MTYPNALEDTTPVDTWLDRCGASGDAEENRPQDAAEGLRGGDSEEVRGSK